jgi:hypothetical protein
LGGKIGTDIAADKFLVFFRKDQDVTGGKVTGIAKRVFSGELTRAL